MPRRSKSKTREKTEEDLSEAQEDVLSFHSLTKQYKEWCKESEAGEKYQTSQNRIMSAFKKAMLENVEVICSVGIDAGENRYGGVVTDIGSKRKPFLEFFSTEEKIRKKKEGCLIHCIFALETALSMWADIFSERPVVFVINDPEMDNLFEYESLHAAPLNDDERSAARAVRKALKEAEVDCMFIGVEDSSCISKASLSGISDSSQKRFDNRINEYLGDSFKVKMVEPSDYD